MKERSGAERRRQAGRYSFDEWAARESTSRRPAVEPG